MKKLTKYSLILLGLITIFLVVSTKPLVQAANNPNATTGTNGLSALEARVAQLEVNFSNLFDNILPAIYTRLTNLEQSGGGGGTSQGSDFNVEVLNCFNWGSTSVTLQATRVSDGVDISKLIEIIGTTSNAKATNVGPTLIFPIQLTEGTTVNIEAYWRGTTKPLSYIITQAECP